MQSYFDLRLPVLRLFMILLLICKGKFRPRCARAITGRHVISRVACIPLEVHCQTWKLAIIVEDVILLHALIYISVYCGKQIYMYKYIYIYIYPLNYVQLFIYPYKKKDISLITSIFWIYIAVVRHSVAIRGMAIGIVVTLRTTETWFAISLTDYGLVTHVPSSL